MAPAQSDDLANAFAQGGAGSVIQGMLAAVVKELAEERVETVMELLEEMAEHQIDAACCLMLSLWPVASDLMLHDICDGIDLWIANNRRVAVIEYLKHVSASEVDPELKLHYEGILHLGARP